MKGEYVIEHTIPPPTDPRQHTTIAVRSADGSELYPVTVEGYDPETVEKEKRD